MRAGHRRIEHLQDVWDTVGRHDNDEYPRGKHGVGKLVDFARNDAGAEASVEMLLLPSFVFFPASVYKPPLDAFWSEGFALWRRSQFATVCRMPMLR
jgi:hypothetical protein